MTAPNIVFITTDTRGRELVSAYGVRPCVETPQTDRLADEGVLFENCYVASPLCTPSRAAWYTGRFPNRSGAWGNEMTVAQHVPLLGELLIEQGYDAFHVGKWHLDGAGYNGTGQADGGFHADTWYDLSNFYDEVGRKGINQFGGWNRGLDDPAYCFGHRVADRAIQVLQAQQRSEMPFFLAVEFDEPHGPYICPPPFRGRFQQEDVPIPSTFMADLSAKPRLQQEYAAYLAALRPTPETYPAYYHLYYDCNSYIDAEIGRVLDAVDRYASENTVVIYTADHGDHLGAFGLCAKGPTMYDLTTAVPLIIRAPGSQAGIRKSALVGSTDIWATILDFAGLKVESDPRFRAENGYACRSLRPLLDGTADRVHDAVFMEYNRFGKQFDQAGGLYPIRCVVTPEWKLSINLFDSDELYSRADDPDEAINRIADPSLQAVRIDLHDQLLAWQHSIQDVFRGEQWERRAWRPDYPHHFVGLTTTGYKEKWASPRF